MSVFLENEYEGTAGIDCEMIAGQVVEAAVDYVTCPFECEVNLMLVGNERSIGSIWNKGALTVPQTFFLFR